MARSNPAAAPTLMWFRDDLRIVDNPALTAAAAGGRPVTCLFVLDDQSPGLRAVGAAGRWWLHHSLKSLAKDLAAYGQTLVLKRGPAAKIVPLVARRAGVRGVHWNRRYGIAGEIDGHVEAALHRSRIGVEAFKANLLFEPNEVQSRAEAPFSVFSVFWRACLDRDAPRLPLARPDEIRAADASIESLTTESLDLVPANSEWTEGIARVWQPGEAGAHLRLARFLEHGLADYSARRDEPAAGVTATISPHLRHGEISPFQIWQALADSPRGGGASAARFRSELGWREFAYHLLGRMPDLAVRNVRRSFDRFPWDEPYSDILWTWRRGRTGYPIVDAGMRELWKTGWMHNRVRMIVASFLTKHLLIDWRIGEEWFWDTLVDADPASNPLNWQWVAGSGADAQPYFRIFNPVLQGEKFDPTGAYVRRFVPELERLPHRFVHKPWQAPPNVLAAAGIRLGQDYPLPMVDHGMARGRALEAFAQIRDEGEKPVLADLVASQ